MKIDAEYFKSLIREEIQLHWDGKVHAAEMALGLKKDMLRGLLRQDAKSGPRLNTLAELADKFGFELYVGPQRPVPAESALNVAGDSDYIKVDRYQVDLSAGPGAVNGNEDQLSPLAFRADWMRDKSLRAKDCVVVNVRGDSMWPALVDGDLVLVDRAADDVRNLDIYAFVDTDNFASVKRFEKAADQLILRSDNPAHPTRVLSAHDADALTIIGRVVWSGREI